jgi:hypothetical protein
MQMIEPVLEHGDESRCVDPGWRHEPRPLPPGLGVPGATTLSPWSNLLRKAIEQGLDYSFRCTSVRVRLADDRHAFQQTHKQTSGGRGLDPIG